MPRKYHVHIEETPHRVPAPSRYVRIEQDGCLGCRLCVKRTSCVYDVYDKADFDPTYFLDTGDDMCLSCFRCVQECRKNILTRTVNPRWQRMGDEHWKPEIISQIWQQARTGKIPVSGAGYRGPFSGPGFDEMWTDMSEIVRPTRDGIHGREYISTLIEMGARPGALEFDDDGGLVTAMPPLVPISIPMIIDVPPTGILAGEARAAMVQAARDLETLAVVDAAEAGSLPRELRQRIMVRVDPESLPPTSLEGVRLVEVDWSGNIEDGIRNLRERLPGVVVAVRLDLDEHARDRARGLAAGLADVIHLVAERRGRGLGTRGDVFVTHLVREIHLGLVEDAHRERVTLVVTGGIALAEHVAKVIICGADVAGLDVAPLVALGCTLCESCEPRTRCDPDLPGAPGPWIRQRIVNLVGSWHSQLIEMMGAMGIREARRLRGEVGRAMFFDDLEEENFAPVFGRRRRPEPPAVPSPEPVGDGATPGTEAEEAPSRFRNRLGPWRVVRTSACIACGQCTETCAFGVHVMGGARLLPPRSHLCVGSERCRADDRYCVDQCPEDAIRCGPDPAWGTFGGPRWPPDLIVATWEQAETGRIPERGLEYRVGVSGGGFDDIDIRFPERPDDVGQPDLSIPLNRRGDGRPEVVIGYPVYGGGMSYGSISLATIEARARAWAGMDSFTCTGEGGYPPELEPWDDHVITQVATGLFGVREETIQRVRIVEFKYAQGAKPGLGGHLLGDKVTPAVARMREAVEGNALFSPFPFHSVYSVEDHKKHVDWIKAVNPRALVSVKVSTPTDVDMVAVGSYHAGAHIIHIDGSYGGTGAAPDIAKKNIAMPIEYAIPKVHRFLVQEGIRDEMTLIASGGLRSAWDVVKAIALGADGVVIGTAEMVALECVRCGVCESGRGCPRGIATTDPELGVLYDVEWATRRLLNLHRAWREEMRRLLRALGMSHVRDLVGRTDLLEHSHYEGKVPS